MGGLITDLEMVRFFTWKRFPHMNTVKMGGFFLQQGFVTLENDYYNERIDDVLQQILQATLFLKDEPPEKGGGVNKEISKYVTYYEYVHHLYLDCRSVCTANGVFTFHFNRFALQRVSSLFTSLGAHILRFPNFS